MGDVSDRPERPVLRVVAGGNKNKLAPPRLTFIAALAGSVYEYLTTTGVHLLGTDLPDICPFSHIEVDGYNYDYDGIDHKKNPQQYAFMARFDVRPEIAKEYFNREKIDDITKRMTETGYTVVYEDATEDWESDHIKIARNGRVYFLDFRFPDYSKGWKNQAITYLREPAYTGPTPRQLNFRSDPRVLPQDATSGRIFGFNADYVSYAEVLSDVTTAILAEDSVNFSLTLTPR